MFKSIYRCIGESVANGLAIELIKLAQQSKETSGLI